MSYAIIARFIIITRESAINQNNSKKTESDVDVPSFHSSVSSTKPELRQCIYSHVRASSRVTRSRSTRCHALTLYTLPHLLHKALRPLELRPAAALGHACRHGAEDVGVGVRTELAEHESCDHHVRCVFQQPLKPAEAREVRVEGQVLGPILVAEGAVHLPIGPWPDAALQHHLCPVARADVEERRVGREGS